MQPLPVSDCRWLLEDGELSDYMLVIASDGSCVTCRQSFVITRSAWNPGNLDTQLASRQQHPIYLPNARARPADPFRQAYTYYIAPTSGQHARQGCNKTGMFGNDCLRASYQASYSLISAAGTSKPGTNNILEKHPFHQLICRLAAHSATALARLLEVRGGLHCSALRAPLHFHPAKPPSPMAIASSRPA